MRHVPACVGQAQAEALFSEKGFWRRASEMFFPSKPDLNSGLPRLELIHFPYYLITFSLLSSKGDGQVTVSVESWSGAFAFFEQEDTMREFDENDCFSFPPKLSPEAAQEIAKEELLKATLRKRGLQGEKPCPTGVLECECFYYPLWIYYFEARRGRISVLIRDAVVGASIGNRTRNGILQAFIESRRNTQNPV